MMDEAIQWSRCCEILRTLSHDHAKALKAVARGESRGVSPGQLDYLLVLGLIRQEGVEIGLTANGRAIAPWCES